MLEKMTRLGPRPLFRPPGELVPVRTSPSLPKTSSDHDFGFGSTHSIAGSLEWLHSFHDVRTPQNFLKMID